eukprot:2322299-Amphidinium_carterae.1
MASARGGMLSEPLDVRPKRSANDGLVSVSQTSSCHTLPSELMFLCHSRAPPQVSSDCTVLQKLRSMGSVRSVTQLNRARLPALHRMSPHAFRPLAAFLSTCALDNATAFSASSTGSQSSCAWTHTHDHTASMSNELQLPIIGKCTRCRTKPTKWL